MSLNGTVWAPIGPSPIDQGAISANGQVTAIAVNPNNSNIIYIGTAWGGVWLTRDGGDTWTPIFDRAPSLGVGEPGATRDRSGRHQHHLRRDQQPRRLAVLRRSDAAAGRAVQVDRRRRELGPPRFRLSVERSEQREPLLQSGHQRRHRRSGQPPDRLPRIQLRPVRFHRWRLQLDAGRSPWRGRALAGIGPDLAGRRAHPCMRASPASAWSSRAMAG